MSPDRDAFGRPIVPPGAQPATGLERHSWPSTGGSKGPKRPMAGILVGLVVLVVLGVGVLLTGSVDYGEISRSVSSAVAGDAEDEPAAQPSLEDGVPDAAPLTDPSGTWWALARLRQVAPGARVVSITIESDSLQADLAATPDRPGRQLTISPDGSVETSAGSGTGDRGFPLDQLDDAAPHRVLTVARRDPDAIATSGSLYFAGTGQAGERLHWTAYVDRLDSEEPQQWTGDLHGRHVVRPDGAPAPGSDGRITVPAGTNRSSLLRAGNLRQALAAVRTAAGPGARILGIDVWPGTASVTVRRGDRKRRYAVDAAFDTWLQSRSGRSTQAGLAFSAVDPAAPQRGLRRISRRLGTDAADYIDYVSLALRDPAVPDQVTAWSIALRRGAPGVREWWATLDGGQIMRASETGTR